MDLNAKSVFFLTQNLSPLLRSAASPETPARVINIVSVFGLNPPELDGYSYSSSKAACLMLTRHLARRLVREHILLQLAPFQTRPVGPKQIELSSVTMTVQASHRPLLPAIRNEPAPPHSGARPEGGTRMPRHARSGHVVQDSRGARGQAA